MACSITLTEEERQSLEDLLLDESTPKRLLLRTKIILLAAERKTNQQIAARLNTDPHTVGRWRN
ncbi:MAG: helix-turn-helix domain-containing protein, partial [Planctomycetes bacterium]|nr:helix-turn-helix domain-containing protein [Planctomycetota bacterium]